MWQNSTDIGVAWAVTTAPTSEPVSVEDAKAHCRITDNASDQLIEGFIRAAREAAEAYMGRGLMTQTVTYLLDGFANTMQLPLAAPLQSVTSVKYYDSDGVQQTLATSVYDTDIKSRPGTVVLKPTQSWPSVQSEKRNGAVEIVYLVGWTTAELVPERIKHGIKQYVAYLDLDRDGMEGQALAAKDAAERCWSDRIWWSGPEWCD